MSSPPAWHDDMVLVIEVASTALQGAPSEAKLDSAISALKIQLNRLEEHRYNAHALRDVVESYLRRQLGSMHDHFDEEVDQMCSDWLHCNPRSYIWTNTAAREAISRGLAEYKQKYPFKPAPPA